MVFFQCFFFPIKCLYAIGIFWNFLLPWSPSFGSFPPSLVFWFLNDSLCVCLSVFCMEDWPEVSLLLSGQEPLLVLFSFLWDFDLWPLCGQGFPIRLDYLARRPQGSTHSHLSSAGIPSTTHVWLVMCMVGTELRSDACTASTLLTESSLQPSSLVSLPKFNLSTSVNCSTSFSCMDCVTRQYY